MLIRAAAAQWGVPASQCYARAGRVIHRSSDRSLAFAALATAAARLPAPTSPTLKPASGFRLVGRSVPRTDIPAKVDGSAIFGIDVRLPGLLHACVAASPVFGGALASMEEQKRF